MSKPPVAYALIERHGFIAVLQRVDGSWTFPGGKIDDGESAEQAAVREAGEESGLRIIVYKTLPPYEKKDKLRHAFIAKAIGGALTLSEPDKFQQVAWMTPQEVIPLFGDRLYTPIRQHLDEMLQPKFEPQKLRHS